MPNGLKGETKDSKNETIRDKDLQVVRDDKEDGVEVVFTGTNSSHLEQIMELYIKHEANICTIRYNENSTDIKEIIKSQRRINSEYYTHITFEADDVEAAELDDDVGTDNGNTYASLNAYLDAVMPLPADPLPTFHATIHSQLPPTLPQQAQQHQPAPVVPQQTQAAANNGVAPVFTP